MKLIFIIFAFNSINVYASEFVYVTMGSDALKASQKSFHSVNKVVETNGVSVVKIKKNQISQISHLMHEKFNRCGGYILHNSKQEAVRYLAKTKNANEKSFINFTNYSINQSEKVFQLISTVEESNIRDTILKLSSYKNRYHTSTSGLESQAFIKKKWEEMSINKDYISIEYFDHKKTNQPSVMMTIKGSRKPNEILVVGGHGDSIQMKKNWLGIPVNQKKKSIAPGADDNASGVATITEIARVLIDSNFRPERTIQVIVYAAEEVGLIGSNEIATKYNQLGKKVLGVVQFDMVNHRGTKDLDIVFIDDFTNKAQNKFLGSLLDTYLPDLKWGADSCGYGCSDHASWHNAGYPASMPAESRKNDLNQNLHTPEDTIDVKLSGGRAHHAVNFAKLGVAYLVEMGK